MRFQRSLALLGVLLAWLALGPLVAVAVVVAFAVPRSRHWLWDRLRPTRRVVVAWVASVAVLVGLVLVIPDGWLPIPPGPGTWVTPAYVGRPAVARPIRVQVPQHPSLAPNGSSAMHDDAWSSDSYSWAGPLGESPNVDTAWYGVEECATLAFDSRDRLIALCGDLHGPVLHVIDADSMRPVATKELPGRPDGQGRMPWATGCAGAAFYLDDADQAVLATTDRRVLVIGTSDAEGEPDLTSRASFDLSARIPADDCLVALMPDWRGNIWFETQQGRVGTVDPHTGRATVLDLGEEITSSFSVDAEGGVYVVTNQALYRLGISGGVSGGKPTVAWRSTYDRGSEQKSGQLSQGSGTTPTLLPGGLVAIADNADPKLHVQFYRRSTGDLVCESAVFDSDKSATQSSLVSVGTGVIVENNHGYGGPLSTMFGRTTDAGLARVDLTDGTCSVVWTADLAAPSAVPKVSLATGLLYALTKEHSWWGANAWYFTGIDARTGRRVFSVRTGVGTLLNSHHGAVTIAKDGSAYLATLGGLVRIRDRR